MYRGAWRPGERVYRCEVGGKQAGNPPLKECWEKLRVVEVVEEEEVRRLARAEHARLGWLLEEVLYPVQPLKFARLEVDENDVECLCAWASVRDSVWASVGASVWDSVLAYIGSLFPNIQRWKYATHEPGVCPFQSGADLWRRGLVPSFDGKTWRLHAGEKAEIVWEGKLG